MAGIEVHTRSAPLYFLPVLWTLRVAQRMAGRRGLRFTYTWRPRTGFRIQVDGSLTAMQSFVEPLTLAAHVIAEAAACFGRRETRVRNVRQISEGYAEALDELTSIVHELSAVLDGTPNSYDFAEQGPTHLRGHLKEFTHSLARYHNLEIPPRHVVEECHTIVELLLRWRLDSKEGVFAKMVHEAVERALLSDEIANQLLELKEYRKRAKHFGQGVSEEAANKLLPSVVEACHLLLAGAQADN